MKKAFILIAFLFSIQSLFGQRYFCRNYNINDGLPSNTINDIYKDSRGFLWLATNSGLARFDGTNFKIYTSLDGLANDVILSITEDNNGVIWVSCKNSGITSISDRKMFTLNSENGLVSNDVNKLYYSKDLNILLVGTENGLSVLYNGKQISFKTDPSNPKYKIHVTSFFENKDDIYIFTKDGIIYKFNPYIESLSPVITSNFLYQYDTFSVFITSKGDTIVNSYLSEININTSSNKIIKDKNFGIISDYKEDNQGNIWIASNPLFSNHPAGIFKLSNNKLGNYNSLFGINSQKILALETDNSENLLWIGTSDNGLYLCPYNNFLYYSASDFNLSNLDITDLHIDNKNNLWICSKTDVICKSENSYKIFPFKEFYSSFEKINKNSNRNKYSYLLDPKGSFEKYEKLILSGKYSFSNPYERIANNRKVILPPGSQYKPLKYDVILEKKLVSLTGIAHDSNGEIWIGSNVGIFKISGKKIKYYELNGNNFSNFCFNHENHLIASSWDELYVYPSIEKNSLYELFNFYDHNSPVNVNNSISSNNLTWFSSSDYGIFTYSGNKFFSSKKSGGISTSAINSICIDNYGNLIAGGNNGIIYIKEFKNDSLISKYEFCAKNGLLGTSVRWLNCTYDNRLIVGTNAGLNIVDLEKIYSSGILDIKVINAKHGFVDYSGETAVIDSSNTLWIGTRSNLIRKDLDNKYSKNTPQIGFYIDAIEVNNEAIDIKNSTKTNTWTNIPHEPITLPYSKKTISVTYDIIHFLDPELISFSHKLEGLEDRWTKPHNDKKITYNNLQPGNYRLRLKIFNSSTVESNQEIFINFIIKPPYWKKWYFIVLSIVILSTIIWTLIVLRTHSIKKSERIRAEIAERITEFEMKALRAQMNPHFIFNAINSIQNYMLDNDVDSALNYLSDFAKLIRITLDNVSKKRISLEDELDYLKYYLNLEKMRFDKKFETEIILPKEINSRKIMIPPMIIQPYIENSIKHGFINSSINAKIKIEFIITLDDYLICIIEDNGIGRKRSREINKRSKTSKSKGTFITNERLALLNQTQLKKGYKVTTIDLYDDLGIACGTRVEINVPI